MKIIFALFLLGLYMATLQAAEMLPKEEANPSVVTPSNEEHAEGERKEGHEWPVDLVDLEADLSLDQIPPEDLKRIVKMAASSPTVDDVPIELFL